MLVWIYVLVAVIVIFLVIIKIYFMLDVKRNGCYRCLVGKTAIVTGSDTGIGFYTAQDFASRGARVILACKDEDEAQEAREKIINNTDNPNIACELVDLSSLTSIRNFAKRIKCKEDRLDILVNNAGVMIFDDDTTEDGLSISMQTNYLGPFLLTTLLIDLLKTTKSARVVNVSSVLAQWGEVKTNNLNYFDYSFISRACYLNYANTKLCVMLWTNELAKRLEGTGVTANSLHPGGVCTNIQRNAEPFRTFLYKFAKYFLITPEEGAQTSVYAAVSEQLQNVSGQYLERCGIASQPKIAFDKVLSKKLWEASEELVKLTEEEKML